MSSLRQGRPEMTVPPWFAAPAPLPPGASVAVIGGGVAGAAVARALRGAGLAPLLVERHAALGQEASGNPCGLLKPRLTADGGLHGRFYGQAYLHACALLDDLAGTVPDVWAGRGLLAIARDPAERETMDRLHGTLPDGEAVPVSVDDAWRLAGVAAPLGGLWYPRGGSIRPSVVCRALAGNVPCLRAEIAGVERRNGRWGLLVEDGTVVAEAAAVVLCGGGRLPVLVPEAELPLHANRGQITVMPAMPEPPRSAVTFGGYVTPPVMLDAGLSTTAVQVVGATYRRLGPAGAATLEADGWAVPQAEDDAANLALLASHLPALARAWDGCSPVEARVAVRATVADHMPLMGPLMNADAYRAAYADLHHGRRPDRYPPAPWTPGLYMLGGLGSRGFQTAPLLAEALAAMMAGNAMPLAEDLLAAVHPARFLVRALRKPPGRMRHRSA